MYILVNKDNKIVASSKNKPSEEACSKKNQKIYEIDDDEFSPSIIGQVLEDFDLVERA